MKYTSKDFEIGIIVTDTHFPYQSKVTLNIALQLMREYQPHYFVHLGDAIDCNGISKYTAKTVADGLVSVLSEIEQFDVFLSQVLQASKRLKRMQYFLGNHEQRILDTIEKLRERGEAESANYWEEALDFSILLPKMDIYKYNQCAPLGRKNSKLFGTHGEFHGGNHTKKHLDTYGCTICYGHLHTSGSYCAVTKSDGNPRKAVTLPCSCDMNPAYMKNKASSWINGLAIFYMLPNGLFNLYPLEIIDKKLIFNGKIYE